MFGIGNAVEGEHGDVPVRGLLHRPRQILHPPVRTGRAGRGNQQRVVFPRHIGRPAVAVVGRRILGSDAPAGEPVPLLFEHPYGIEAVLVTGIAEGDRSGDAVLPAAAFEVLDILGEGRPRLPGDTAMAPAVIAYLEALIVEPLGLLPAQVVLAPVARIVGNEERGAKPEPFEQGRHEDRVGDRAVVEGEDHEPLRNRKLG